MYLSQFSLLPITALRRLYSLTVCSVMPHHVLLVHKTDALALAHVVCVEDGSIPLSIQVPQHELESVK